MAPLRSTCWRQPPRRADVTAAGMNSGSSIGMRKESWQKRGSATQRRKRWKGGIGGGEGGGGVSAAASAKSRKTQRQYWRIQL
jgi:hypothetical protein